MAKRKQSAYDRERRKLMQKIRYWENKGYTTNIDKPLTEKQLREQGITGKDLAQETRNLKGINERFQNQHMTSTSSGEHYSNRKELKESQVRETQMAYQRFYDFMEQLVTPIEPMYREDSASYTRHPDSTLRAQECQAALQLFMKNLRAEFTDEEIGKHLVEHPEIFEYMDGMFYGSDEQEIVYCYDAIIMSFGDMTGEFLTVDDTRELLDEVHGYVNM